MSFLLLSKSRHPDHLGSWAYQRDSTRYLATYHLVLTTYSLVTTAYYLVTTTDCVLPTTYHHTTLSQSTYSSLFCMCLPQNEEDRSHTSVEELWSQPADYMQYVPHYVAYNSSLRVFYLQHQALVQSSYWYPLLPSTHYYSLLVSTALHCSLLLTTTRYYSLPLTTTHYYSLLLTTTLYYSPTNRLLHSPIEHSPRRRGL
jgi:hypothetical protein